MRLHEYQARDILGPYGIRFPRGQLAEAPDLVESIAWDLNGTVVVKAQVLVGGRGKAGGVKLAGSPAEARQIASNLLGTSIKGHTVRKVLVTKAVPIAREFYLGALLDRSSRGVTFMASAQGGVDIEDVARSAPESITRVTADPLLGLLPYQARELVESFGLEKEARATVASVANALYAAFIANDCSLLELNPLVVTKAGDFIALDAKMVVDDNALFRRPKLAALRDMDEEDPAEIEAQGFGLHYVRLDGTIGCIVNGAGLAMATMDTIKFHGGEPANFLDVGGGASPERVAAAVDIILRDSKVRALLVNILGGITRCDRVAEGLKQGLRARQVSLPVVVRLAGTNQEEGWQILEGSDVHRAETMSEAADMAVRLANQAAANAGGVR
jgi:succinyl-CoA synthetase beta subunit